MARSLAALIRKRVLRSWRGCAGDRICNWRGGFAGIARDCLLANGTGEPGRASADAAGLPGRRVVFAMGRAVGAHHQTVQRCAERALAMVRRRRSTIARGPAGGDGRANAKARVVDLACARPRNSAIAPRIVDDAAARPLSREPGPAEGRACLAKLAQATACNILNEQAKSRARCAITWNATTRSSSRK
jgi:hypothetical protein